MLVFLVVSAVTFLADPHGALSPCEEQAFFFFFFFNLI